MAREADLIRGGQRRHHAAPQLDAEHPAVRPDDAGAEVYPLTPELPLDGGLQAEIVRAG